MVTLHFSASQQSRIAVCSHWKDLLACCLLKDRENFLIWCGSLAQGEHCLNFADPQVTPLSLAANGDPGQPAENLPERQAGSTCAVAANRQAPQELEPVRTGHSLSAPLTGAVVAEGGSRQRRRGRRLERFRALMATRKGPAHMAGSTALTRPASFRTVSPSSTPSTVGQGRCVRNSYSDPPGFSPRLSHLPCCGRGDVSVVNVKYVSVTKSAFMSEPSSRAVSLVSDSIVWLKVSK